MKTNANTTKGNNLIEKQSSANKRTESKQFNGRTATHISTLDRIANSPSIAVTQKIKNPEEEEVLQGKFETAQKQTAQETKPNKTGLPDNLKNGVENLSGFSMDDVKVSYNSPKPAQLQAHAYAQGNQIHLGPGQEKHLPHEAWHVVQQKQGRVKPTLQMKGNVNVNDDAGLEKEADVMGGKALQMRMTSHEIGNIPSVENTTVSLKQKAHLSSAARPVVQRLKVENTDWTKVRSITASTDGVGGVLFLSDASNKTIVVKPNVPGDEEMASAHAHAGIDSQGERGQWKVHTLGSRIAQGTDVGGIRVARQRVEAAHGLLTGRAATLMNAVAAGTTLIQKGAKQGSGSLKGKMIEQSADRHIKTGEERIGTNKDKVKDDSPLKPIMHDNSGFVRSLGRLAAADLLVGNFDRLADAANLENLLINKKSKSIHPIDNTGGTAVARLLTNGGGAIADPAWTGHRLVAPFIAGNYAVIANETWDDNPHGAAMTTIYSELIEGFEGVGINREYTVTAVERVKVKAKLNNHLAHIRTEYAHGLAEGRQQLIQKGPIPATSGVSPAARQQYAARLAIL